MFDIGWTELVVVACVAVLVVGPKDLPKMLRAFGKTVSQFRRMAGDFQRQFDEALKEAELDEIKKIATGKTFQPLEDARKSMQSFQKSVNDSVRDIETDVKSGMDDKPAASAPAASAPPAPAVAGPAARSPEPVAMPAPDGSVSSKPRAASRPAPKTAAKAAPKAANGKVPAKATTAKAAPARAVAKTAAKPSAKGAPKTAPKAAGTRRAKPADSVSGKS